MPATIRARLDQLGIRQGTNHEFGAGETKLMIAALDHYARHLREASGEMQVMKHAEASLALYGMANQVIDIRDTVDLSFEVVARCIGE